MTYSTTYTSSMTYSTTGTYSSSGTYSPSPTYSNSGSVSYSGSPTYSSSLTQTGTYSTSITTSISITNTLPASKPFGVLPPGLVSFSGSISVNAPLRQVILSQCGNSEKDYRENCDYYLDKTNKCCTKSCHFTYGGKRCASSQNCWKFARCTAYGECRGRKPKPKGASCQQPTSLQPGQCDGRGLCTAIPTKRRRRKGNHLALKRMKLQKKLNLDLASEEEDEDNDGQDETLGQLSNDS